MDLYYQIAEVCHEANRGYCQSIGDDSQLPWSEAAEWQKYSAAQGVKFKAEFPLSTPADSHKSWLIQKQNDGWTYGEIKDVDKKQHPCMVEYDELPAEQRAKDHIFQAIAGTLLRQRRETDERIREASKLLSYRGSDSLQHDGQG